MVESENITIREYVESDKARLLELIRLNTPQYFAVEEEADLSEYLDLFRELYYVIEENGVVQGCGGINLAEDGVTAKISWDIVNPACQGKGLGSRLMMYRIEKIREMKNITILSVRTSQLVYKFYEKFGLHLREVIKDYWAEGLDMYRLDCQL